MKNRNKTAEEVKIEETYVYLTGDDRQDARRTAINDNNKNPDSKLFRANTIPVAKEKPAQEDLKQETQEEAVYPLDFGEATYFPEESSEEIECSKNKIGVKLPGEFLGEIECSHAKINGKPSYSIIKKIQAFNKNELKELQKEKLAEENIFNNLQEVLCAIARKELTCQETFAQLDLLYKQLKQIGCDEDLLIACKDLVRFSKAQLVCLEEIEKKLLDDDLLDLETHKQTMTKLKEQLLIALDKSSKEKRQDYFWESAHTNKNTF